MLSPIHWRQTLIISPSLHADGPQLSSLRLHLGHLGPTMNILFFNFTPISILFSFWWHSCSFLSGLASLAIIFGPEAQFSYASYDISPLSIGHFSPRHRPPIYVCLSDIYCFVIPRICICQQKIMLRYLKYFAFRSLLPSSYLDSARKRRHIRDDVCSPQTRARSRDYA